MAASLPRSVGLAPVCEELGIARSTIYAQRAALERPSGPAKRGPKPLVAEADILTAIRTVLTDLPFLGEGYRKVHARLRHAGIRADRERIRNLMRRHGIRAPGRPCRELGPRVHDGSLSFERRAESLAKSAVMDGIYVIHTSVPKEVLADEKAVLANKGLAKMEGAFRTMNGVDLQLRPIYHRLENRVKANMFICMLAYYVESHLRSTWAEQHYTDEAGTVRKSPVSPVEPSRGGSLKKQRTHSQSGFPLQTFRGLMQSLATLGRIRIRLGEHGPLFTRTTKPTTLQARALQLIGVEAV